MIENERIGFEVSILEKMMTACGTDDLASTTRREIEHWALQRAIEAVKARTELPVCYIGDGYSDGHMVYDMATCPRCDNEFEQESGEWECNYCPECGQRLKW